MPCEVRKLHKHKYIVRNAHVKQPKVNANELKSMSYLLTAESVRIMVIGVRMFFKSHTLTDLSSDPLTTLSPDANMADVTELCLGEIANHQLVNVVEN